MVSEVGMHYMIKETHGSVRDFGENLHPFIGMKGYLGACNGFSRASRNVSNSSLA